MARQEQITEVLGVFQEAKERGDERRGCLPIDPAVRPPGPARPSGGRRDQSNRTGCSPILSRRWSSGGRTRRGESP